MPVGGAFLVFFVAVVIGKRHLPVGFALIAKDFAGGKTPGAPAFDDLAIWVCDQVVIPAGVALLPKVRADQRDPFAVEQAYKRNGAGLSAFCADGGELDDGQADDLGSAVPAAADFEQRAVGVMEDARQNCRNRTEHQETVN